MIRYLENVIFERLGEGAQVIARYEEGSYQGNARVMASDGTLFAEGEISWGSCSYCDPWHDMTGEEIMRDVRRHVDVFTRKDAIAYLTSIAKLDEEIDSYWDHDKRWAREALVWIANNP